MKVKYSKIKCTKFKLYQLTKLKQNESYLHIFKNLKNSVDVILEKWVFISIIKQLWRTALDLESEKLDLNSSYTIYCYVTLGWSCDIWVFWLLYKIGIIMDFPSGSAVNNLPAMQIDPGSIPGWGRFPGEGNDYPIQYSCMENNMNTGAWWVTVYGVTESDRTEQLTHTHTHTHTHTDDSVTPAYFTTGLAE